MNRRAALVLALLFAGVILACRLGALVRPERDGFDRTILTVGGDGVVLRDGLVVVGGTAEDWQEVARAAVAEAQALEAALASCDAARVGHLLRFHPESLYESRDIVDDDGGALDALRAEASARGARR